MLLSGAGLSCLLHFILFPLWELHQQFLPLPQAIINGSLSSTYTRAVISPSSDFAWAIPFTCHAVPGNIYKSCLSPLDLCTSIIWPYYVKGHKLHTYVLLSFRKPKEEKMWKQSLKFFFIMQKFHPPYPIFILLHSVYHHLTWIDYSFAPLALGFFFFFYCCISAPRIVSGTQQALMNVCRKNDSMTSLLWHPCWFVAMLWFFLTKKDSYSEGYHHPLLSLRSF